MAVAGLMHAGKDCIDGPKRRFAPDASPRNSGSGAYTAISVGRRFERADDGRPNRNDTPAFELCVHDRYRSFFRDVIRLVEREPQVEERIAS